MSLPPCLPTGSLFRLQSQWFIHSYLSESPVKEPSHENGQNICSLPWEPHVDRKPTYNGVRPGSPTGSFTHCYHYPVPCSLQHDTCHVDLGRPEPRYPALSRYPTTPVTTSHMTQGRVRIHMTLRYGRGFGFMGGDDIITISLCDGKLL
jgi:hypothetical protein